MTSLEIIEVQDGFYITHGVSSTDRVWLPRADGWSRLLCEKFVDGAERVVKEMEADHAEEMEELQQAAKDELADALDAQREEQ